MCIHFCRCFFFVLGGDSFWDYFLRAQRQKTDHASPVNHLNPIPVWQFFFFDNGSTAPHTPRPLLLFSQQNSGAFCMLCEHAIRHRVSLALETRVHVRYPHFSTIDRLNTHSCNTLHFDSLIHLQLVQRHKKNVSVSVPPVRDLLYGSFSHQKLLMQQK